MNATNTMKIETLKKMNTDRMIALYNKVFNTNIWEQVFNPYEEREWMIVRLSAVVCEKYEHPEDIQKRRDKLASKLYRQTKMLSNQKALTEKNIGIIRALLADGVSRSEISKGMDIPLHYVANIARNRVYKNL